MLRSIRLIQHVANFSRLANPHEVNPKVPDWFKSSDYIEPRFIGSEPQQVKEMLKTVEVNSLDELVDQIIPKEIRSEAAFQNPDNFPDAIPESAMVQHLQSLANKNKIYKNYIGQGFYGTHTPYVVLRNVLEDPGWYTSYTPYQAEISQGRLEALLNYQTVITELTGMDVSNASLLDEATAAGEAMFLANSWFEKKKFFVDNHVFPQSIEHIKTKAYYLGIDIVVGDAKTYDFKDADQYCGVLVQSPDNTGEVHDWSDLFKHTLKDAKLLKVIYWLLQSNKISKPFYPNLHISRGYSYKLHLRHSLKSTTPKHLQSRKNIFYALFSYLKACANLLFLDECNLRHRGQLKRMFQSNKSQLFAPNYVEFCASSLRLYWIIRISQLCINCRTYSTQFYQNIYYQIKLPSNISRLILLQFLTMLRFLREGIYWSSIKKLRIYFFQCH